MHIRSSDDIQMFDFNEWRECQNSICIRISSNETENMSYTKGTHETQAMVCTAVQKPMYPSTIRWFGLESRCFFFFLFLSHFPKLKLICLFNVHPFEYEFEICSKCNRMILKLVKIPLNDGSLRFLCIEFKAYSYLLSVEFWIISNNRCFQNYFDEISIEMKQLYNSLSDKSCNPIIARKWFSPKIPVNALSPPLQSMIMI